MPPAVRAVQRTYLLLTLLSTLAASFIWGVNTLFLLDAGLTTTEAFVANAFFALGMVIFEVPTGVVADTRGRRASFLLGAATLFAATLAYLLMWQIEAPLWGWAVASAAIGLGFTFFSGAVEAWLVDALASTGFAGDLAAVFGRGQTIGGIAMLAGTVAGGYLAQVTNLAVPYLVRSGVLALTFVVAAVAMHDIGFAPKRGERTADEIRRVLRTSIAGGWRHPPVRWMMLATPFTVGVSLYVFYAMQPYLLELYGDDTAFGIAGLAAAVLAGAQIAGGLLATTVLRMTERRTEVLIGAVVIGTVALGLMGVTEHFGWAVALLVIWAVGFAAAVPVRQAYLNSHISSGERATVLSFVALMGSSGSVVAQPLLGRSADAWGFGASYLVAGATQAIAIPFLVAARRHDKPGANPAVG
ncbi:MAG: MFS transporter [Acidimicrobiia bacterium]|nr:MFS transporter [Acidimicrobiia bacterium]